MKQHILQITLIILIISCRNNTNTVKENDDSKDATSVVSKDTSKTSIPSVIIQEDSILHDTIAAIRENYNRIQAVKNWTKVEKRELAQSSEGGEATYYYTGKNIEKVTAVHYSEMGQLLQEFYLKDGGLSFVFEKELSYPKPFDIEHAKDRETRSYFYDRKLIRQLGGEKENAPGNKNLLHQEQERIVEDFGKLMGMAEK